MAHGLEIGVLNCWNRCEPIEEAIINFKTKTWTLCLNETNPKIWAKYDRHNYDIFGISKAIILAPKGIWHNCLISDSAEAVAVSGHLVNRPIFLVCIYLSPSLCQNDLTKATAAIHEMIYQRKNHSIIVAGDFNTQSLLWAPSDARQTFRERIVTKMCIHLRLESVFAPDNNPTWSNGVYKSWIDACVVSGKMMKIIRQPKKIPIISSDHCLLYFKISQQLYIPIKTLNMATYRKIVGNSDLNFLKEEPTSSNIFITQADNLDHLMKHSFESSINRYAKRRSIVSTEGVSKIRLIKHKMQRLLKKYKDDHHAVALIKKTRRKAIKSIMDNENNAHKNLVRHKINNLLNRKDHWSIAKHILGHKWRCFRSTIEYSTTFLKNKEMLLEEYTSPHPETLVHYDISTPSITCWSIEQNEIDQIMTSISKKKCSYNKHLNMHHLHVWYVAHKETISNWIMEMINRAYIPYNIKLSKIIIIPKKDPNKCRPLAIMHPLYKFVDAVIKCIIVKNTDLHHRYLDHQLGFLPGKDPLQLFFYLTEEIQRLREKNINSVIIAADISNAFEEVSYKGNEHGMHTIEAPRTLINLTIQAILDRHSFHNYGKVTIWRKHTKGVPQGSILGPTLFAIATAHLYDCITPTCKIICYADDLTIVLSSCHTNPEDGYAGNTDWIRILCKLRELGLTINMDKTAALITKVYCPNRCSRAPRWTKGLLRIGTDLIKITRELSIIGTSFRSSEWYGGALVCRNTTAEKIEQLSKDSANALTRLRALPWPACSTVLRSVLTGIINYFLPSHLIIDNTTDIVSINTRIVRAVNKVIGTTISLKSTLDKDVTYHIVMTKAPYILAVERIIGLLANPRFTFHNIKLREIIEKQPNCEAITWTYDVPVFKKQYEQHCLLVADKDYPLIKYKRRYVQGEHRIMIWKQLDTFESVVEYFNYWAQSPSYLDALCDAIGRYAENNAKPNNKNEIFLEADKGLIRRLLKPVRRTLIQDYIHLNGICLCLVERDTLTMDEKKEFIPRTLRLLCPRYSNYEIRIRSFLYALQLIEDNDNMAIKILAYSDFKITTYPLLNRRHLYALVLIAGGWRTTDAIDIKCTFCNNNIDTAHLMDHCIKDDNKIADIRIVSREKLLSCNLKYLLYSGNCIRLNLKLLTTLYHSYTNINLTLSNVDDVL